jgi:hypothetical protein
MRILNDGVLAESLGRRAKCKVLDRFSMERVGEQYGELYRDLLRS